MALHGHCRSPIMGQPDSNKGSYQKWQFLIVPLLAACHMSIRAVSVQECRSEGVGRSGTTHMDGHTAYNRKYFAVKEKKNSKAGVGG